MRTYYNGGGSAAWQRKEGKSPSGGLNKKGRASYKAQTGGTLKAPTKSKQVQDVNLSARVWAE